MILILHSKMTVPVLFILSLACLAPEGETVHSNQYGPSEASSKIYSAESHPLFMQESSYWLRQKEAKGRFRLQTADRISKKLRC